MWEAPQNQKASHASTMRRCVVDLVEQLGNLWAVPATYPPGILDAQLAASKALAAIGDESDAERLVTLSRQVGGAAKTMGGRFT